ncbi:MAG: DUF5317 family protein [Clostridiaceae bacterium]|nr:DUF5317 family protein [Clostridiaceae bacterium]
MIPFACLLGLIYSFCFKQGNFRSILRKHFHRLPLLFISLACEMLLAIRFIDTWLASGSFRVEARVILAVLQYTFLLIFLFGNRRKPGVWLLIAGSFMNGLVITANRGCMPIGPAIGIFGKDAAARIAGAPDYFLAAGGEPFYFLADLIPFPLYMISAGDILISIGIFLLAAYLPKRVLRPRAKAVEQPPDIRYTEGR